MNENLFTRGVAEATGTFAFTFVGAAAICTDAYSGGAAGLNGIALAHGLVLVALIAALAPISGAHLNPAVTLGAVLTRAMDTTSTATYVGAQLAGAVLAGLVLIATFGSDVWAPVGLGTPMLGPGVAGGTGIFLEAALTFVLVFVALRVGKKGTAPAHAYGLATGVAYAACMLVGWPLTGAAMNPARAIGPALASGNWSSHYVYWLGPALGAVVAALAIGVLVGSPATREPSPTDRALAHDHSERDS